MIKKFFLLGVPAVLLLLAVVYGREALDLYRLMDHVEKSTEAYQADGGPWPQLMDVCSGCHGAKGQSKHQRYPSLAGLPAVYTAEQLRRFASGARANPNMGPLAMTLSEAEIEQLADYYARQPIGGNAFFNADPRVRESGEALVAKGGCSACHGDGFVGRDAFPRLAGQGHDYLLAQLDAYAAGTRRDPTGAMNALLAATTADDRRAMASYLASAATPVAAQQQE